ncbi:hypothetical protein ACQ4M4_12840 [Leptolyngbya sp. AN02str]|uniref:hypothetical protein n=1 Tax=Leptolyngbya sp. AN02str TaxID=3423363 RepID=UPI003D322724
MSLADYPAMIAEASTALLRQEQKTRKLQDIVAIALADVDQQVAFDETLKNEAQRKARKAELLADPDLASVLMDLQDAKDAQRELEIQLEQLRSEFAVQKLAERRAIAVMELRACQVA